jgi:hypothetical protein
MYQKQLQLTMCHAWRSSKICKEKEENNRQTLIERKHMGLSFSTAGIMRSRAGVPKKF